VDLLGPCGAFTESCRPLTFSLSPAGTPESESFPPDVLSYRQRVDLAAYGGLRGVDLPVKGPCFAQLVESHTGISPRTPSVVFQTYEPKPIDDALAIVCSTLEAHPHRFAFCPSAPVRQAVLRISSWLAPSFGTVRTCARPVKKTRDASNRLLPPTRITCTRTSCVPNSLRWLPSADAPRRLRLHTARLGDRMFHDIRRPLRRIVTAYETSSSNPSRAGDRSVGVFFPRHACDRASDTPVAILRSSPALRRASSALPASLSWPHARVFTG